MGATNSTLNYQLSQFIATDKPAWLQDYNGDMEKIDVGINGAKVAADTAQNTANSAVSSIGTVTSDISALQTDVLAHTNSITDLQGDVNTIESLIGNGTPTTTDHTLIGAINELHSDILNSLPILAIDNNITYREVSRVNSSGSYTIPSSGYYQISVGTGATAATASATVSVNNVVLHKHFVGTAYASTEFTAYFKAGTVLTFAAGTATTAFIVGELTI